MSPRLFVLDTHGVAVWLFHRQAAEQRDDANGEPCEMLDAFEQWLLELLTRFEPTHVAACLEGRNNWRMDEARGGIACYKANRKPVDTRLKLQLNKLPALIESLGVRCVKHDDHEADDIAATIATKHAESLPVVLVSGDKDWSQLIDENVCLFSPVPDKTGATHLHDFNTWAEKMGFPVWRMPEYLALVGDASDNVAGVEGWGKVTATNAIAQTRSWAELVRKARTGTLAKIRPAVQAALIPQLPAFEEALRLVTLRCDAPITETLDDLAFRHPSESGNSARPAAAELSEKLSESGNQKSAAVMSGEA